MDIRLVALLKRATAGVLYYSGLLWLYAAIRLRHRAVVLMYHRVLPSGADTCSQDGIIVRPETFARQMSFLRRYFRPISVQQLAGYLERRDPLPTMSCVITFDDGWADNFEHALPILAPIGVPATVFVAADFIGSNDCFWQERLTRRMFQAAGQEGPARDLVRRLLTGAIDSRTSDELRLAIRATVAGLKKGPATEIAALEGALKGLLHGEADCTWGVDRFMSWEQAALLASHPDISIGAHGCSHTPFTALSEDRLDHELRECRVRVESSTGDPVVAVAYPNGDFSDLILNETRRAGYRLGFTTRRGHVSALDDPFKLRRINIHESATATIPEFLCTLLGVFRGYQLADDDARSRHGR